MLGLGDPSEALLGVPWRDIGVFRDWRANPQGTFFELSDNQGRLPFDQLADTCISHVVQALVASEEFSVGCRRRAYHLLQALNNIPSLPNAVPGPMSARGELSARQQNAAAMAFSSRPHTSQWLTSNREGFPLFSPREPQAQYAPSIRPTQRDMGWRVFPVEMRPLPRNKF